MEMTAVSVVLGVLTRQNNQQKILFHQTIDLGGGEQQKPPENSIYC